jgi:hypothetical protein
MLPVAVDVGLQVSVQPLMSAKSQKPPVADAGTRGPRDWRTPGLVDPGASGRIPYMAPPRGRIGLCVYE